MTQPQLPPSERGYVSRPTPDPTELTTQATDRMADALRREMESIEKSVTCAKEVLETRLEGIDKEIELLRASADTLPTLRHEAVDQLRDLHGERFLRHDEKFHSIQIQFAERDTRTEQTSRDNKVAIDAALQAQKEAVAKSEVGFTKQIDNIGALIATQAKGTDEKIDGIGMLIAAQTKGTDEKIDDLKTRMSANDGRSKGIGDFAGYIFGGVSLLVTIIALVFVVLKYAAGNGVAG